MINGLISGSIVGTWVAESTPDKAEYVFKSDNTFVNKIGKYWHKGTYSTEKPHLYLTFTESSTDYGNTWNESGPSKTEYTYKLSGNKLTIGSITYTKY